MALDQKVAVIEKANNPGKFGWWLRLSTLTAGQRICLPLRTNTWFEGLAGEWKNFCQINLSTAGELTVGRIKEIPTSPYKPELDVLGLDVCGRTLISTSEGDQFGHRFMPRLIKLDRQISTLAANRQRMGLTARSPRYDRIVRRIRDFVRNEIHRTLRTAILRHRPRVVAAKRLDFRAPELSLRMNRLVQNLGRRAFKDALKAYSEQYGFKISDVDSAFASRTCHRCGYVDKKNRNGIAFKCRYCGHTAHADGNAARNHAAWARGPVGRSDQEEKQGRIPRAKILEDLVTRFLKKEPRMIALQREIRRRLITGKDRERRGSTPCQAMLDNPYFGKVVAPLLWGPPTRE